jgi:hypothetical protein
MPRTDVLNVCLRQEAAARKKIEQAWKDYSASDKRQCLSLSRAGGIPTYTGLLTCLEMAKQARNLHERPVPPVSTTGQGQ